MYQQVLVQGLDGVTTAKLGSAEGLLCNVSYPQLGLDMPGYAGARGEDVSRGFQAYYSPAPTDEDGEKNISAIKGNFDKDPREITISYVVKNTKNEWETKLEYKLNKGMVLKSNDSMGSISFMIAPQLTKDSTLTRREGTYTEGVKVIDGSKA